MTSQFVRWWRTAAGLSGLVLVTAGGVAAQDVGGRLEGRTLALGDAPFTGAAVVVTGPALVGARVARTDARGYFLLPLIPVGQYTVRISAIGHRPVVIERVAVELGRSTTLGIIRLEIATVELPAIVVTADPVILDPTTTTIGGTLRAESFATLPVERDYRSIAALLPLANTSYLGDEINVAGASGSDNMYFIDGVNVTDGYTAATGTNLPYNFIEAIEVKQGGYEAEYGQALGGILNVITRMGTDAWQVGATGYFTNSTLAAEARPGLADLHVDRFASYDVGLNAGGPIVRDRLRIYGAYNPSFVRTDVELSALGPYPDTRTAHYFAGNLSWRASQRTDVTLSVFGDVTVHDTIGPANAIDVLPGSLGNPDPFLGHSETGGVNLALRAATTLGSDVVLEVLGYRHGRHANRRGRTAVGRSETLFRNRITLEYSGGWGWFQERSNVRTGAKVTATLRAGRHRVKAGVEYQDNGLRLLTDNTAGGLGVVDQYAPRFYTEMIGRRDQTVRNRVPTFFVQDSWRASDRLRVNAGIRWDGQYLIGVDGRVVQSITDQWQPRIGIVFQPGQLGSQKITASVARYYQQLPLFLSTLAHAPWESRVRFYSADPRLYPDSIFNEIVLADPLNPDIVTVDGLRGEHLDEVVIGYEARFGRRVKVGASGMYRILRETVGSAFDADRPSATGGMGSFVPGNPGRGELDFVLPQTREYLALTLTAEYRGPRIGFGSSYVLSRNYGSYTGLYESDLGRAAPQSSFMHDFPSQMPNNTGLLPNDRTHVFKAYGSYRLAKRVIAGLFATWQTGTPISELGAGPFGVRPIFLTQRGSVGRTPSLWDVNLRFVYDVGLLTSRLRSGRVLLDVLHLGSQRQVVRLDQRAFLALDPDTPNRTRAPYEVLVANQINPNPYFRKAITHQPPMTVRLGFEVQF